MHERLLVALTGLSLAAILGFCPPVKAQWGLGQTQSSNNPQQRKRLHSQDEFAVQMLKTAPQLPYLPEYSGREPKFRNGIFAPSLKSAQLYEICYLCKETPDQVKTWYENALKGAGWTINQATKTVAGFQAIMPAKGLRLQVVCSKTACNGYATSLNLRYSQNSVKPPTQ